MDDRSKFKRNAGKIYGGLSLLGAAATVTGTGMGLLAPKTLPIAIPLAIGGLGLSAASGVSYLRNMNQRNKELQLKMIDAYEKAQTKKQSFQDGNTNYIKKDLLEKDSYKGKKLTHGLLQAIPVIGENIYQDLKYQDNMRYLTGKKPKGFFKNYGTTALGGGASLLAGGGPLQALALANSNRQDREVQIEAIKLANKLNKKLGK